MFCLLFVFVSGFSQSHTADQTQKNKDGIPLNEKNKGVGPVKHIKLNQEIDRDMAERGKLHFNKKCTSCHDMDNVIIGSSLKGVVKRRSPEWIMNMILAPERMIAEDSIARSLVEEYGTPMSNMKLSEEEGREIFEYFRTLDE